MDARMREKLHMNADKSICLENGRLFSYRIMDNNIYVEQVHLVITEDDIDAALRYRSEVCMSKSAEKYSYILAIINSIYE